MKRGKPIAQRIVKESDRIANITKELFGFARDDHNKSIFVDICPLIRSAIDLIEKKIHHQGVGIEFDCSKSLPKTQLYPQGLQQVVINLIDNAADACRDKDIPLSEKVVKVSCDVVEKDEKYLCLEGSGRGIGMAPEVLVKAKETFFSTKPSSKGTGLGLSIVTDIVNRHNGELDIASVEGECTKVKIYIPYRGRLISHG